jgi:hypothetical protein
MKSVSNDKKWHEQIAGLPWEQGFLDESSYRAALKAATLKLSKESVLIEIQNRIADAGDTPKVNKLISQINRAYDYVSGGVSDLTVCRPRARFREDVLHRIAAKLPVHDVKNLLASRSVIRPEQATSESFLNALYHSDEMVLVFTVFESQGQALWPTCHSVPNSGPDGVWFLINPVDGKWHYNPRQQNKSRRSEESITSFRFALLESDEAELTDWLKCLAQIPLRIAAIYESGGRSIHALVRVDAPTKAEWNDKVGKIKPMLVTLGADGNALTAVRLSRLPQALRGERLQRLLYLNPSPDAVPICNQPAIQTSNHVEPHHV